MRRSEVRPNDDLASERKETSAELCTFDVRYLDAPLVEHPCTEEQLSSYRRKARRKGVGKTFPKLRSELVNQRLICGDLAVICGLVIYIRSTNGPYLPFSIEHFEESAQSFFLDANISTHKDEMLRS